MSEETMDLRDALRILARLVASIAIVSSSNFRYDCNDAFYLFQLDRGAIMQFSKNNPDIGIPTEGR